MLNFINIYAKLSKQVRLSSQKNTKTVDGYVHISGNLTRNDIKNIYQLLRQRTEQSEQVLLTKGWGSILEPFHAIH
jgi:hypothetical protein